MIAANEKSCPKRRAKRPVTFLCPPGILDRLDEQVAQGVYSTRSEAIVYHLSRAVSLTKKD
jgi:Arc/MetJ-type ribon-helix-helix transcriptional regulator